MAQLHESIGGKLTFTHDNKTYSCSLVTQKVKQLYEQRLFERAKSAARDMRDCFGTKVPSDAPIGVKQAADLNAKKEYFEFLEGINRNYLHGVYSFESVDGLESMNNLDTLKFLVGILFSIDDVEAEKICLAAPNEVGQTVNMAIKLSFPGIKESDSVAEGDVLKKKVVKS